MEDEHVLGQETDDEETYITLEPGSNADSSEEVTRYISSNVLKLYDVYSYRHAAAILKNSYPEELSEIENALLKFSIQVDDFAIPGGNESIIPKKFSSILRPLKWLETRIQGDLIINLVEHSENKIALPSKDPIKIIRYIDGHKIDYVKGRVALDLEWNSKDQTFDRDLYAFRMFHECGIISVAALVTRSEKLNAVFNQVPLLNKQGEIIKDKKGKSRLCKQKYGASTTWMGKLLYRLNAGRNGGCPVLVFGIRPDVITDLQEFFKEN